MQKYFSSEIELLNNLPINNQKQYKLIIQQSSQNKNKEHNHDNIIQQQDNYFKQLKLNKSKSVAVQLHNKNKSTQSNLIQNHKLNHNKTQNSQRLLNRFQNVQRQNRSTTFKMHKHQSNQFRSRLTSVKTLLKNSPQISISKTKSFNSNPITMKNQSIINKPNVYQQIAKQLKAKLPTPKQKFLQFLQIPPFNRNLNHMELITHFLKKYHFFKAHPPQLIQLMARKVVMVSSLQISDKMLIIVQQGSCQYEKKVIQVGSAVTRNNIDPEKLILLEPTKFIGLFLHQYRAFLSTYFSANFQKYKKFLAGLQIFKIFSQKSFDKLCTNLSLFFYTQGQILYSPGDEATHLFVVQSGMISRRVIVQIDKTNKIPIQKFTKKVKIISRSYQHKVVFQRQDLVGIADILQSRSTRKQLLHVQKNSLLIGIDRNVLQQNLDDYISDRLLQYNNKKYPQNYDCLCQNYMKEKQQARKAEQRKIAALQDTLSKNLSDQRNTKINSIIKLYHDRIKDNEKRNLIAKKKQQRDVIQN